MTHLTLPYVTGGLTALLVGALLVLRRPEPGSGRSGAIAASLIALACFLGALLEVHRASGARLLDPWLSWFEADALDGVPMIFYAALTALTLCLAPKRDTTGRSLAGMLSLAAATEIAYAASNLAVLATGWWLTALPFALGLFGNHQARRTVSVFLAGSALALTGAILALHPSAMEELSHVGTFAMWMLVLAVFLRKGLFPLHPWVVASFEHGPLLPAALVFNGHLGALLIARSEAAALPAFAIGVLDWLGIAALVTALVAGLRGIIEKKPRRLLAFVCISQASFILAGLATANPEGITGSLVHWLVVAAASSGLVGIVRILEVRVMDVRSPEGNLGLAVKAPRLATFFLVCGLALVGLPGTLGYCAEDLLFHSALTSHPFLGIALLVSTAFNAINLLRLFSVLFLGVLPKHVIDIPDALPRERWPLAAYITFLVLGGILPGWVLPWRAAAAREIQTALTSPAVTDHAK